MSSSSQRKHASSRSPSPERVSRFDKSKYDKSKYDKSKSDKSKSDKSDRSSSADFKSFIHKVSKTKNRPFAELLFYGGIVEPTSTDRQIGINYQLGKAFRVNPDNTTQIEILEDGIYTLVANVSLQPSSQPEFDIVARFGLRFTDNIRAYANGYILHNGADTPGITDLQIVRQFIAKKGSVFSGRVDYSPADPSLTVVALPSIWTIKQDSRLRCESD